MRSGIRSSTPLMGNAVTIINITGVHIWVEGAHELYSAMDHCARSMWCPSCQWGLQEATSGK